MTRGSILRLVDANANRALEGVRVCEDIVRFSVERPQTFRRLRALRHAIAACVRRLPGSPLELLRARASRRDMGRDAPAPAVRSLKRLLVINLQRVKEALRVLEECSRLIAPRQTSAFHRLRFRTYEIERELFLETLRHR